MEKWTIILSIFLVVQVADILAKKGDGGGYGDGTGDGDGYGDKYGSGYRPPKPYGPYCPMCKDVEGPGPLAGTYYFYDKVCYFYTSKAMNCIFTVKTSRSFYSPIIQMNKSVPSTNGLHCTLRLDSELTPLESIPSIAAWSMT